MKTSKTFICGKHQLSSIKVHETGQKKSIIRLL